ncbi:MAG: hypothetical protein R3E12_02240 [Candidatus Eisenbacteria bacterium]
MPALIDPTSVHLVPKGGNIQVLEQNFQYDLAGPDRILQRFVDSPVDLVLKEGDLKNGTLLSFEGGSLVLRGADGRVSLVQRDQVVTTCACRACPRDCGPARRWSGRCSPTAADRSRSS